MVEVVLDERTHVTVLALAGAVSALVERFRRIVRFAQPVDMFAYTGHVECVVLMSKVKE